MADLDEQLTKWIDQVENTLKLTPEQRGQITGAGAQAYAETLKKNTPVSDENYSSGRSVGHINSKHGKKPRKTKHLRDSITYKAGYTADKLHTGATAVGFDSDYQGMVARFVNNGTQNMSAKEIKNMHFMDRTNEEAKDTVLKAESAKYKEVTGL